MGTQASKKCTAEEAELERRVAEKIAAARESPHLRCNQMGLQTVPSALQSNSGDAGLAVQQELMAKLRSADFQANALTHFPPLELPQLRDLNLWGNNMSNEMLEGATAPGCSARKRGKAGKFRTMLRPREGRGKRKRSSSSLSSSPRQLESSGDEEAAVAVGPMSPAGLSNTGVGAFSHMPLLDSLDLSNNRLSYLPPSISACSRLEQLSVEGNLLTNSPEALGVLSSLVKLTMLNLSLNRLTRLPSACLKRDMLYTLLVRGNSLLEVPAGLHLLTALQRLDLSDNCIASVHEDAFQGLSRMKTLLLSYNELEALPPQSFASMDSLSHLMLHHNALTALPPSTAALTSLRVLDASYNLIDGLLPASLTGLTNLTELNLSFNRICQLPDELAALVQLRKLTLGHNDLRALPASMTALVDLMEVDLSWNRFSYGGANSAYGEGQPESQSSDQAAEQCAEEGDGCGVLWQIPSLEILSLACNDLAELPEHAFARLTNLRKLCLASNCFTNAGLPLLGPSMAEEETSAGGDGEDDGVEKKESSRPACVLELVALTDNYLTEVPLAQLQPAKDSLQTLLLSSNPIGQLPVGLNEFTALEHLCVTAMNWEGGYDPEDAGEMTGDKEATDVAEVAEEKDGRDESAADADDAAETAHDNCGLGEEAAKNADKGGEGEEKEEEEEMEEEGEKEESGVEEQRAGEEKGPPEEKETAEGKELTPRKAEESTGAERNDSGEAATAGAPQFFPPDLAFGRGLDKLKRLYVGNHCNDEELIAGTRQLAFDPSLLPALLHSDIATLDSFPWRGSSCELPGALSPSRPCGWAAMTGTAPHAIEDRVCLACLRPLPGKEADLVAVFDGHGGGEVALYVQEQLPFEVERQLRLGLEARPSGGIDDIDVGKALSVAFEATNNGLREYLAEEGKSEASVGCTAAVALITRTAVYCANVGDSRVVLATLGGDLGGLAAPLLPRPYASSESNLAAAAAEPVRDRSSTAVSSLDEGKVKLSRHRVAELSPRRRIDTDPYRASVSLPGQAAGDPPQLLATRLSVDHKPGLREEVTRVREAGAYVAPDTSGNTYRLTGGDGVALAVSRAFGDFYLVPGVIVEPFACQRPLTVHDRFLLLGSDGIWDVLSDQEAVLAAAAVLRRHRARPQLACMLAASHLRDLAFALGSKDDLSVVVVSLDVLELP